MIRLWFNRIHLYSSVIFCVRLDAHFAFPCFLCFCCDVLVIVGVVCDYVRDSLVVVSFFVLFRALLFVLCARFYVCDIVCVCL